jgi:REP-associated tyrosine transposase
LPETVGAIHELPLQNTMDDPSLDGRRSIRLRSYDYSWPGAYFLTVCAHDKECAFGRVVDGQMRLNEFGQIVESCWLDTCHHYPSARPDIFIVMPNHVHGIIEILAPRNVRAIHELPAAKFQASPVGAIHELPLRMLRRGMLVPMIVGRFKMKAAKRINLVRNTPGRPVWQRNYFERIIRNEDELLKTREYVATNPFRWALDRENPEARHSQGVVGAIHELPLRAE